MGGCAGKGCGPGVAADRPGTTAAPKSSAAAIAEIFMLCLPDQMVRHPGRENTCRLCASQTTLAWVRRCNAGDFSRESLGNCFQESGTPSPLLSPPLSSFGAGQFRGRDLRLMTLQALRNKP